SFRQAETPTVAAAKAGFSAATAYRIEQDPRLRSQKRSPRGRRRQDPLAAVWDCEVVPLLKSVPGLRPVAIFDEIRRRHPEIAQLRVRTKDQVDTRAGPLELVRLLVAPLVYAFKAGGGLPLRAHVEQVDEEVVRQRLRPLGEDAVRGFPSICAEDAQATDEYRHLRGAVKVSNCARSTNSSSADKRCPRRR